MVGATSAVQALQGMFAEKFDDSHSEQVQMEHKKSTLLPGSLGGVAAAAALLVAMPLAARLCRGVHGRSAGLQPWLHGAE